MANEVSYVIAAQASAAVGFNTISTARGQKFKITLPDGTIASLDAASSFSSFRILKATKEKYSSPVRYISM